VAGWRFVLAARERWTEKLISALGFLFTRLADKTGNWFDWPSLWLISILPRGWSASPAAFFALLCRHTAAAAKARASEEKSPRLTTL